MEYHVLLLENRHKNFRGKVHTLWMGPYKVKEVFHNESLQLMDLQGQELQTRVNGSPDKKITCLNFEWVCEGTTSFEESHVVEGIQSQNNVGKVFNCFAHFMGQSWSKRAQNAILGVGIDFMKPIGTNKIQKSNLETGSSQKATRLFPTDPTF